MRTQEVVHLLDCLAVDPSTDRAQLALEAIMNMLTHSIEGTNVTELLPRLPLLLRLQSFNSGWEKIIALALDGYLPSFYDGTPPASFSTPERQ